MNENIVTFKVENCCYSIQNNVIFIKTYEIYHSHVVVEAKVIETRVGLLLFKNSSEIETSATTQSVYFIY